MQKNRAIVSARAFLDSTSFELVVDILGLQPKKDWTQWEDSEGNLLKVAKNKTVHVYPAKEEAEATMDVYRKARPSVIADHSYWVLAAFGREKSIFAFLGNDGVLRCSYFENNTWKMNLPPVLIGFQALNIVASGYIDIDPRKIRSIKLSYPKGFEIEEAWATGYPTTDTTLQERIQCHLTNQSLAE